MKRKNNGNVRRLTRNAMLTTIALTIFIVEAQIPIPVPLPGVKLGLANIVTLYAVFMYGAGDAFSILLCRIVLGSIFGGQMMSFLYSLCGGMLCYFVTLLLHKIMSQKQIWICGVLGAVAHNIGQITAAIIVTGTVSVLSYLPLLMISGIVSGAFTGFCTQFAVSRMK